MMREQTRVPKLVALFEPWTPSYNPPDSWVDEIEARRRVSNGEARRINRGRAIRLFRPSTDPPPRQFPVLRGQSCKPGPDLIERFAEESQTGKPGAAHVILATAWPGHAIDRRGVA